MKIEVRRIGNSYGVILPKQLIESLHVKQGDTLYAIENDNGVTLTPYDPEFEKAMRAYDKFSHRYKNALRELAK
jgi:antitoxin MazE